MSLMQDWAQSVSDEMELKEAWALGEYVEIPCPNCNRMRLCECDNGKHRCEKCNWVPENNAYCEVSS
jgi:ribosomal protein L37AE/L43A